MIYLFTMLLNFPTNNYYKIIRLRESKKATEIKAFIMTVKLSCCFFKSLSNKRNKTKKQKPHTIWETLTLLSQNWQKWPEGKKWQGYRRLEQYYQPPQPNWYLWNTLPNNTYRYPWKINQEEPAEEWKYKMEAGGKELPE